MVLLVFRQNIYQGICNRTFPNVPHVLQLTLPVFQQLPKLPMQLCLDYLAIKERRLSIVTIASMSGKYKKTPFGVFFDYVLRMSRTFIVFTFACIFFKKHDIVFFVCIINPTNTINPKTSFIFLNHFIMHTFIRTDHVRT